MEFLEIQIKKNVINLGIFQMYWWDYHIVVLQKCREIPTVSIRFYLMTFLALVFVGASGLLTHSKGFIQ